MDSVVQTIADNELRDPSGSNGSFRLPCGFLEEDGTLHRDVVLRAFTGVEEDILASRRVRAADKMNLFLSGCIVSIGDITDPNKIRALAPRLLIGDRTFLFFALRRITHGDVFPFRHKCPNPNCKANEIYRVDLSTLVTYPMPKPEKRTYEITLPHSGHLVVWHPMDGTQEARRDELKKRIGLLTLNLLLRVEAIDGRPVTADDLARLPSGDRDHLRTHIDEHEGGVETTAELICPVCGEEFERDVDPSEPSFFFPSEMQQRWKRKSSSSSTTSEFQTPT